MRRIVWIILTVILMTTGTVRAESKGEKKRSVKALFQELSTQKDSVQRKGIIKELNNTVPQTEEDAEQIRNIVLNKKWDEEQFDAAMNMTKKINKAELDGTLIKILKDEKKTIEEIEGRKSSDKTEKEMMYRHKNIESIIRKLGELKSRKSVEIIKEYLDIKGMQFVASEALGQIGDKSDSNKIQEKAYKGEEVNYGGLGIDEAKKVIQDLQDDNKKDKWPKIAKQIVTIKNPEAKPYLKKLFKHKEDYVRQESAGTYIRMADDSDTNEIVEMSSNTDVNVRYFSIDGMKKTNNKEFENILCKLVINDPVYVIRVNAAKALGYKKIKNAIPYLEKALKDGNLRVRQEAFVSLYILTAKKYEFEGKDAFIERRAEYEKKYPSFN